MHWFRVGLITLTLLTGSASALAQPGGTRAPAGAPGPTRDECDDAYRNAQQLRQKNQIIEARTELIICSSNTCPEAMIGDCVAWYGELTKSLPSLTFEISRDGHDASNAHIFVDGKEVADWSHAYQANPGRHVVRVELASFPAHQEEVVLAEGQRLRLFTVQFTSEPKSEPKKVERVPVQPRVVLARRTPILFYPLLGLGVAGLGSFGTFAYLGQTKQKDLEHNCQPDCTDAEVRPMKQRFLAADISLGVGGAALVSALLVFLTRPETAEDPSAIRLGVISPGSSRSEAATWGLSATGRW